MGEFSSWRLIFVRFPACKFPQKTSAFLFEVLADYETIPASYEGGNYFNLFGQRLSTSFIQRAKDASEGIRKSLRGERVSEPTFGPSGRQERLN